MAHVTELAQHVLTLEPEKDAARLCFYHYLKNLCGATEPINSELLNRFFRRALGFPHWQENKALLFREVSALLYHYQETHSTMLDIDATLLQVDTLQIVNAETPRTLETVISRHLEKTAGPYDRFRLFNEGNERLIAVVQQANQALRVTAFPKTLAILGGELVPLNEDFSIHYTPELTLQNTTLQQMEIGPHTAARFRVSQTAGIQGVITRGYTFQRFLTMNGGSLHNFPMLFYPLKRLEQFFINRKTDPMYLELTSLLEKAIDLMGASEGQNHPDAKKFAAAALERGRLALEHIFPDDKVVRYLINNLEEVFALTKDESWPQIQNSQSPSKNPIAN
jgi:hypothetical protein